MKNIKEIVFTILIIISSLSLKAQSYAGVQNTRFTYFAEIDTQRFVIRFQTVIGKENLFIGKAGYKLLNLGKSKEWSWIVFAPVFNYSLKEDAYNTPLNSEIDYRFPNLRLTGGVYIYKDKLDFYFSILLPFKIE